MSSQNDTHAGGAAGHGEEHEHHVCSLNAFLGIYFALLFFTFITVAISLFDFGGFNLILAMLVAAVKASLVMAIFMHLRWDTPMNNVAFISSVLFLSLLFVFTMADMATRADSDPVNNIRADVNHMFDTRGDIQGH